MLISQRNEDEGYYFTYVCDMHSMTVGEANSTKRFLLFCKGCL